MTSSHPTLNQPETQAELTSTLTPALETTESMTPDITTQRSTIITSSPRSRRSSMISQNETDSEYIPEDDF